MMNCFGTLIARLHRSFRLPMESLPLNSDTKGRYICKEFMARKSIFRLRFQGFHYPQLSDGNRSVDEESSVSSRLIGQVVSRVVSIDGVVD